MYRYKHAQTHLHTLDDVLNETCQPPWDLCAIVQSAQGVLLVVVRAKQSEDLCVQTSIGPKTARSVLALTKEVGRAAATLPGIAVSRRVCEQCGKASALLGFRYCAECRPEGYEKCSSPSCETSVPKGMLTPLCMACTSEKAGAPANGAAPLAG